MPLSSWWLKKTLGISFNVCSFTTTIISKVGNTVIEVGSFMREGRSTVLTNHVRHDVSNLGTIIIWIVIDSSIGTSHGSIVSIVRTNWTIDFTNWRIDFRTVLELAVTLWPTWPTMTPDIETFPDRIDNIFEQPVFNFVCSQSITEIKVVWFDVGQLNQSQILIFQESYCTCYLFHKTWCNRLKSRISLSYQDSIMVESFFCVDHVLSYLKHDTCARQHLHFETPFLQGRPYP